MASQPSSITLSVDADLDGSSPADEVWSSFDDPANRHIYHGEDHTPVARDTMTMYRTLPKKTATFHGVFKSSLKFSMDVTVDTPDGASTVSPIIGTLNFSVPVGATDADVTHVCARLKAAIAKDGWFENLVQTGMV